MKNLLLILFCLVIFIFISISYFYFFHKRELGLVIDKMGMRSNTYKIAIDDEIQRDTYIYWLGEVPFHAKKNQLLIYHRTLQADILPSYGKNWILIQVRNISYTKMGIFKYESYSKHNYLIDIKLENESLIINWKISNWYDLDIYQGIDTIKLK
jgi:hypothetical protein